MRCDIQSLQWKVCKFQRNNFFSNNIDLSEGKNVQQFGLGGKKATLNLGQMC